MSRTKNAVKNIAVGIISKIVIMLFAFAARTVFIHVLGNTYLGINGLFTEVLSLLSLAELGFGTAMTFSMYKPVAMNDEDKIIQLLDFYKKVYRVVALVIAGLGLCLVPIIGYIVKGADWLPLRELQLYFGIYLFNTIVGYLVAYKYIYINALQKNYVTTGVDTVVSIASYIIQIVVMLLYKDFIWYLLANSFVLLVSRLFIVWFLNKKYPVLKKKTKNNLSQEEKSLVYHEVKGLAIHQFAGVAVHSTDNLIISSMISVVTVGLLSNYNMLMNSVLGFVAIIFNSVIGGFGNLVAEANMELYRKTFKEINFINFWIYGFCSIAFWILIPPFITLWIGSDQLIDTTSFTLIVLNCYFQGQCAVYHNARIAKGNFNKDKWWAITQAIVNLVVSVIGAKLFGLVGVYIGTIASRMIYVVFRPRSTYKFMFGESSGVYYKILFKYFVMVVVAAVATKVVVDIVLNDVNWLSFIGGTVIVFIMPNIIFGLLTFRLEEMKMLADRVRGIKEMNKK